MGDSGKDFALQTISVDVGLLSRELAAIVRARGGRGAAKATTCPAGDDALLVLFRDCFTRAEKTLWEAGAGDTADRYRRTVAQVIEPEMTKVVESVTGRLVQAAFSDVHHEPDVIAHVFLLAPLDSDGSHDGGVPSSAARSRL